MSDNRFVSFSSCLMLFTVSCNLTKTNNLKYSDDKIDMNATEEKKPQQQTNIQLLKMIMNKTYIQDNIKITVSLLGKLTNVPVFALIFGVSIKISQKCLVPMVSKAILQTNKKGHHHSTCSPITTKNVQNIICFNFLHHLS